ncbi:MAG: N-acetyltransferase [Thermoanaerobaculia bacterium]|nr:N-acetyltransferase [Thermoanaerobaculia bacterium]
MEIRKITEGAKGYFVALDGEREAGRMYFTNAGADKIIIDHTEVDDAFRGQKVGQRILDEVVRYARENGIRIIPLCPFAKSVFDKTAEIRDVLF